MQGIYDVGTIKKTNNQKKKHILQMSNEEKEYLLKTLQELNHNRIIVSNHLGEKNPNLLTFKKEDVINILESQDLKSLIVEYNQTPFLNGTMDYRVLLRDNNTKKVEFLDSNNQKFEADANLCFVISLRSLKIITVYWNLVNDNHNTINWSRYSSNLQIIKP